VRILVVQSELGVLRGGGENFTKNLFLAFSDRGHDVSATFIADSRGLYPIPLPSKIRALPLAGHWSRKLGQESLSRLAVSIPQGTQIRAQWDRLQEAICWRTVRWHEWRFARRIWREFSYRWNEFDAVYVHGSVVLASKIARYRPTVLRLPGPVSAEVVPVLKQIHVVAANGDALIQIRRFLGGQAAELPIGIDGKMFKPGHSWVRERLGWTKRNWVIGYVGRLAYVKGIDLLAEGFKLTREKIPHARLIIVGSGEEAGKLRSTLRSELDEGVAHIVSDVPHELLADWYRAMNLFVMPSRYENYSNAVLEALACGVPFLGSNVGGNLQLAETNKCWVFDHGSSVSMADAICSIANNPSLAIDRGAFCAEKIRQMYCWETSAKRLEDIFRSCFGKNNGDHVGTSSLLFP
jgi:glycosyltransferase involved in cell wall biosynthesis